MVGTVYTVYILGWGELKTLAGYTYILLWTCIRNEMVMVL